MERNELGCLVEKVGTPRKKKRDKGGQETAFDGASGRSLKVGNAGNAEERW